ncbi:MAG: hypothetical protein ABSB40_01570 [Nitrososphaeria archaeon]|jgi:hypothetical protein
MNERNYRGIEAVKELTEVQAVNDHLLNGWELLSIKERAIPKLDEKGNLFQDITLVYVLGLKRTKPSPVPTSSSEESFQPSIVSQQAQEPALSVLPWKAYKQGEGEWVFSDPSRYKDPPLTVEQFSLLSWLFSKLRREGKVEIGAYIYQLSGDKEDFISRNNKV